ncbi:hypothetical protein NEMIN01_1218 [Nematocida minor]|uniref:uncharacterized protein n=1 Tax=Nematocida minor TaxID=1912983 RepID=UPI00221EB077|nr:uncharacterized protein NEMIN01_1218 [Nematocida minor]KAI5190816.1 hypothetical protein NEMIN01_1218 [Nematocida minor]
MMDLNTPQIQTKEHVHRYFSDRNISRGVVIFVSEVCNPCKAYKELLSRYFNSVSVDVKNRFLLINVSHLPREMLQNDNYIVRQFGVQTVPSTFVVEVQDKNNLGMSFYRTPSSINELNSLIA